MKQSAPSVGSCSASRDTLPATGVLTPVRRRNRGRRLYVSHTMRTLRGLLLGFVALAGCSSSGSSGVGPTTLPPAHLPTTVSRPIGSPQLLAVCSTGARDYDGVVIAAFKDPNQPGEVLCWDDGHVGKSPPPGPGRPPPRAFDRLVLRTTLDGKNSLLIEAGYRNALRVTSPLSSVP